MSDEIKYVKGSRPITTKGLRIAEAGRTLDQQIEDIRREGIYTTPRVLRNSIIGGLEIKKKGASCENLIVIGCFCFGTAMPFRSFCLLLDSLGVEYNFLDKEYCCGWLVVESQVFSEGGKRDKADQASREFIGMNIAMASEVGAKRMIYFCPWCVYLANRFYPESDIPQIYAMDFLADVLKDKKLHIEPTTIGYFGGTPHRRPLLIPDGDFDLNWGNYRKMLEGIEGLTVVNIPRYCCGIADWAIWKFTQKQGLHKIVTPCSVCYGRLMRKAPAGTQVWHISQFLLNLLDPIKAAR